MKIEEVRIDEISYHEKNPKQHPDKQIRLLQESIKRFGWTNPVILSADNTILAGHARVKAAIAAGNDTVPCIRTKLTGAEADAYLIADNRLSDLAPYDRDILAELLGELPDDLAELTGFNQVQVDALLSGEDIPDIEKFISESQPEEPREEVDAEPQIDRAAELNEKWQVKPGDLWQLGEHRIICGDCTDPVVVERVMMGEKAALFATDPPYGVAYGVETGVGNKFKEIANDENDGDKLQTFLESTFRVCKKHLKKDAAWYLWHAQMTQGFFAAAAAAAAAAADIIIHRQIIWVKPSLILGHGDYHWRHELCFYGWCEGNRPPWYGDRKQTTVWEVGRENDHVHPTQKPVELYIRPLNFNTKPGEVALDPFLGSGTTLIACENTGRKCRGIEISPEYCAVVLERFKEATGKEPVRINE